MARRPTIIAAIALLILALLLRTDAAQCKLDYSLLTSAGCPETCTAAAGHTCLFYSPNASFKNYSCAAPIQCYRADAFQVPTLDAAPCSVTYSCVDLSSSVVKVLLDNVSRVVDFEYPKNVTQVVWNGINDINGVNGFNGTTPKGVLNDASIDASFFRSPDSLLALWVYNLDLHTQLHNASINTKLSSVVFSNVNITAVPQRLKSMTQMSVLDLSNNNITEFPDWDVWKKLTFLTLSNNLLTEFNVTLPLVTYLDLMGNPLKALPSGLFEMSNIKTLRLKNCGLRDLHLNSTQYSYFQTREKVEADFKVSKCRSGYSEQYVDVNAIVCVEKANGTSTTRPTTSSSNNKLLWILLGSGGAGLCIVGFAAYRLCFPDSYILHLGSSMGKKTNASSADMPYMEAVDPNMNNFMNIWADDELLNWMVDYDSVSLTRVLAKGNYGEVWLGRYANDDVVIKRMREDKRSSAYAIAFVAEIKLMARFEHPKIVRFLGVTWRSMQTLSAITEYMSGGDLLQFLGSPQAIETTWGHYKSSIALDIVEALVYLHSLDPPVIHRDLKSRNVMLSAELTAKLSDFGISRQESEDNRTMTAGVGTARWMAPEVIVGGHYSAAADMYSFGVLLTELDTCQVPFHAALDASGRRLEEVAILQLVSEGELVPSFSAECPVPIQTIGLQCLQANPDLRPSAVHISYALRQAVQVVRKTSPSRDAITLTL